MGMFGNIERQTGLLNEKDDSRQRIVDELGKDEYDQQLADSYYKEREGSIDNAFYNASRTAAADMGKRGLSGSGMGVGQQVNTAFSAAAQKAAARNRAIEQAKAVRRRGLLDEAGVWTDLQDAENQKRALSAQDQARDDSRAWGLVGIGLGGLL